MNYNGTDQNYSQLYEHLLPVMRNRRHWDTFTALERYAHAHDLTAVCRCLESHSPSFKAKSSITSAHWPATSSSVCSSSSAPSWQVETHHVTTNSCTCDVLLQIEHDFSWLRHSGTRKHAAHRFLHTEKWNGYTTMTKHKNIQINT